MQYPDFRRALTHNIASGRTLFGRDLLGITNKPEGLFAKNPPPSSAPSAPHNILPISPVSLSPPLLKNESRARGCRSPSGEESRSEQVSIHILSLSDSSLSPTGTAFVWNLLALTLLASLLLLNLRVLNLS
jgi:hypothetical protein